MWVDVTALPEACHCFKCFHSAGLQLEPTSCLYNGVAALAITATLKSILSMVFMADMLLYNDGVYNYVFFILLLRISVPLVNGGSMM